MSRACARSAAGDVSVSRRLPFLDPLDLHQAFPARYPHLLESAAPGANGRYDILFAFPGETLRLAGDGRLYRDGRKTPAREFLPAFDNLWREERSASTDSALPFTGGWFVYLGYELAHQIEPTLGSSRADDTIAFATRFPAAVIRDRQTGTVWAVCEQERAHELLAQIQDDAESAHHCAEPMPVVVDIVEEPEETFLAGVVQILEYIRAGDVFQVNLSRAWRATLAQPSAASAIYRRLRAANPAPFAGIVTLPQASVVSSSPERLVEVRAGRIRTRPIAGTYPRSRDAAEDAQLARELLLHPKERAEHIMLIDLERNDLGRICEAGSVEVSELMALESYTYVHHIVSEVTGRLSPDVTPGQVIAAVFPGGTITGCPKVRCMQIIAELEGAARGAYTGSMGYVNRDGSLDLNILIRSLTLRGREITFRAGGGIVADSIPQRELQETRAKARGLLEALQREPAA